MTGREATCAHVLLSDERCDVCGEFVTSGREATCRHCGGEVTPQRFSTTGWMHSTGIIVCPGQQHYLMSAVRKAAEPSASARETT